MMMSEDISVGGYLSDFRVKRVSIGKFYHDKGSYEVKLTILEFGDQSGN